MSKTTLQVRLYPMPEQGRLLVSHCQEYIGTVNVLASAFESGVLEGKVSTKDFTAALPSAVKNQALRDAHSVYKRSLDLDCLSVLKKAHLPVEQSELAHRAGHAHSAYLYQWQGTTDAHSLC
jgi:hypothetical protein